MTQIEKEFDTLDNLKKWTFKNYCLGSEYFSWVHGLILCITRQYQYFFLIGFTLCKAEQPLHGMELQEKEA